MNSEIQQLPDNCLQTQNMNASAPSSAYFNATPLHKSTEFDRGDSANVLHDLRDTGKDLSSRDHNGLTPVEAGLSFPGRQGRIPTPLSIPQASHPALTGTYNDFPQMERSQASYLSHDTGSQRPLHVPPH